MTLSVVAGAAAALAFGISTLCSAAASRSIGAASTLGWVAMSGLLIVTVLVATSAPPTGLDAGAVGWLIVAGAGNAAGLLFAYRGVRLAKVAVVAPILSTEGAVAAALAVIGGQALPAGAAVALAVIAVGVAMAGAARSSGPASGAGALWALAGAAAFGCSLYATARAGATLPLAWAVLPPRLIGVLAVGVPLAIAGRLKLTRAAAPLVAGAGVCEVAGFVLYTVGARQDIAIAAVLVSLFGAVAALLSRFVFSERLSRTQLGGVATIVAGVVALSLAGA